MANKIKIIQHPHPILKTKCSEIKAIDKNIAAWAKKMLQLMKKHNGCGLAAPQVGLPLRMFICNPTGKMQEDEIWINPVLYDMIGCEIQDEGCLSMPNVKIPKKRPTQLTITGLDIHGQTQTKIAKNLLARIYCHEVDHLNGILIIQQGKY